MRFIGDKNMKKILVIMGVILMQTLVLVSAPKKQKVKYEYVYADLTKFANTSLVESSVPLQKFSLDGKFKKFKGMRFKTVNAEENGGRGVLTFNGKVGNIAIPLPKNNIKGPFTFYMLFNVETNGVKPSEKNQLNISLYGKENERGGTAYPKAFTDIGDIEKNTVDGKTSIVAHCDDSKSKKGYVYMYARQIHGGQTRMNPSYIRISSEGNLKINIYAITLSTRNVDFTPNYDFSKESWKPINIKDTMLVEGSILDVSKDMGEKPAGKYGRVVVRNGHFEFENRPNQRVKFKSTNWRPASQFEYQFKDKKNIDKLIGNARARGYNMIRWRLSHDKLTSIVAPYTFSDYDMDRYDYFLYVCGREGIYSHLMISSHLFGGVGETWAQRFDLKIKLLFGDKETRESWRKMAHAMLNHVNPYTGLAWKDDPSIATTEYFNELDTIYPLSSAFLPKGNKFTNNYLRKRFKEKYGTIEKLNASWGTNFKAFEEINLISQHEIFARADKDISDILRECSRDLQKFFEKVIKEEIGFKAPVFQHNCGMRMDVFQSSFEMGDFMAQNTYAAPQSGLMKPGGSSDQRDWLSEELFGHWFLYGVMKRVAGMPFAITEFQHRHWNPYKHQAGVFYPAYAGFHDYDMLTVHDMAIYPPYKRNVGLCNFGVYNSPVFRANEFLNYCLFFRGDVTPAKHRVEVEFSEDYMKNSKYSGRCMAFEQAKTAFLTGFGPRFTGLSKPMPKAKPADIVFQPDGCGGVVMYSNREHPKFPGVDSKMKIYDVEKILREKSILPKENISDTKNGVFQTDTGEIEMRLKEGFVKVCTPRTEAVSLKPANKNEKVGNLVVKSVDVPSAVAICSMDGNEIAKSGKLVMVVNTDNISSGFKVSADRSIIKDKGGLPVLVRTIKLSAELKLDPSKQFEVYALNMLGERLQKLEFPVENGVMKIELDTAKLEKEPSVFYEIIEVAKN